MLAVVPSPLYLSYASTQTRRRQHSWIYRAGYALVSSQSVVEGHLSVLGRLGQDSGLIEVPLGFQSIRLEDE
jgi:hypothetical protein